MLYLCCIDVLYACCIFHAVLFVLHEIVFPLFFILRFFNTESKQILFDPIILLVLFIPEIKSEERDLCCPALWDL